MKHKSYFAEWIVAVILLAGIAGSRSANAQTKEGGRTMGISRYGVQIDPTNAAVTIWVNEVPGYRRAQAESSSGGYFFNPWLRTGHNTVRYRVSRLKTDAAAKIRLGFFEQNMETREAKDLHSINQEVTAPVEGSFSFDIASFPSLSWHSAEKIELNDQTRKELLQELNGLITLMNQKNTDGVVGKFTLSANEKMNSLGLPAEKTPSARTVEMTRAALEQSPPLALFDPAALKFELAGQGHVVVVERNDGSPLIRMDHPDGGILRKERLYFGRIGGRWEILG